MDSTNNALFHHNQETCSEEDNTSSESDGFPMSQLFHESPEQTGADTDHDHTQTVPTDTSSYENSKFKQTSPDIQSVPSEDKEEEKESEPRDLLLWALQRNDFESFSSLLKVAGVDPKFKHEKPHCTTAIELACRSHWGGKFVKILLDHGVKPNVHEVHPEPIHYAAKYGNPEALEALLQNKKTKINIVDSSGRTALHHAVSYYKSGRDTEYERCIELLLKRPNFALNIRNNNGYTAVQEAANLGHKTAVELILKYRKDDVDLDSYRTKGRTARESIQSNYPELIHLLPIYRVKNQFLDNHGQLILALQDRQLKKFHNILCLVDEHGNARVDPNYCYGRPHFATCLEIACREKDCAEYVNTLLRAGADPNFVNPATNQTALHLAVQMRNVRVLTVLLKDRRTNINAVHDEVRQLIDELDQQTDNEDTEQDNEEAKKDKDDMHSLKLILRTRESEIENAICKKHTGSGATLSTHTNEHRSQLGQTLFQHLYDGNCEDFNKKFSEDYKDIDNGNYTLLQFATLHSLKDAVQLLLESGANPNAITTFEKRPPILLASMNKDLEIMKLLLGPVTKNKLDVNVTDAKGNTALHHASNTEYLECVVDLMRRGADIRHKNVFDKSPLPAKSVEYFLDKSLQTNNEFPDEEGYKIIFDYSFLVAHNEKGTETNLPENCRTHLMQDHESGCENVQFPENLKPEMDLLFYISRSNEHRKLMQHPVITSFLHMKWQRVKSYFYINIFMYVTFAILLNTYILLTIAGNTKNASETVTRSNDTESSESNSTSITFNGVWIAILLFLLCFTGRELLQLALSPKVYFKNYGNILDIGIICFSGYILFRSEWQETFVVITIMLSWTELILLTGRLPKLSTNIEMFKSVSLSYFQFLLSYIYVIIAFAFSFYILLHKNATYSSTKYDDREDQYFFMNPLTSVMKTFVMMMGEFEADKMVSEMANSPTYSSLFALFVFIIAMLLLSLLTGLVSDTQAIKSNAKQLSLVSRIRLIYEFESTLLQWHTFVEQWPKYTLLRPFINFQKSKLKNISLFPDTSYNKRLYVSPNKGPNIVFELNGLDEGEGEGNTGHPMITYGRRRGIVQRIFNLDTRCNGQNTSCKMPLVIIGEVIGIISNRGSESDVNIMKGNLSQIQEMLKENESKLSKIENKMEENQQLLEDYQQKLTDNKIKVENDKIQSKNKGSQKMKHNENMSHKMQNTTDKRWSHTEATNQETK